MPKGHPHYEPDNDFALAEFCARIQERIILFAAETGTRADRVAERLSALLSPPREGFPDHLPPMREEAPRIYRTVEPLALAQHARGSGTPATVEAEPVPRKVGSGSYWNKMTPEQRSKEMAKRKAKWKPEALAKWSGAKPSTSTPSTSTKEKRALHSLYQGRYIAKLKGEPPPPLPSASKKTAPKTASKAVPKANSKQAQAKLEQAKLEHRRKMDRERKAGYRAAAKKAAEAKARTAKNVAKNKVAKKQAGPSFSPPPPSRESAQAEAA